MKNWPVFKSYFGAYLRRIALPIGGIGTGTISLGGRGDWRDWEIVNRPAKGFKPGYTFFCIRTECEREIFASALEGPIPPEDYEGSSGCAVPNHGLPHFAAAEFQAAYPLGQVALRDPACPLEVTLQAFNPFVPGDENASGFPVALCRYRLRNPGNEPVQASIAGNLQNFIGTDGTSVGEQDNSNHWRQGNGFCGLLGASNSLPETSPFFGTLALAVLGDGLDISRRTAWAQLGWGDSLLDFWDDFSTDGRLEEREREDQITPVMSLCAATFLQPGETRDIAFLLAWHFPNRVTWSHDGKMGDIGATDINEWEVIGNYYTAQFADAWAALDTFVPRLAELEDKTVAFAEAFYGADLPAVVKEAAGFNLSTLRTQTVFRTPDGRFYGWEGIMDREGSCFGSCTHVWNYEQATAHLFYGMARSMRETELLCMTDERGAMHFRIVLPLERYALSAWPHTAADGQMGCIMKLYREWKLSGDTEWMAGLWPAAKKALEFCWIPGGWDGDGDGVMEGCQHNTMDVEYFGPNPQMQGWYLGALAAAEEMAREFNDTAFAGHCRTLREAGSRWMDEHLFNGDYYEHQITMPASAADIAPGLSGAADIGRSIDLVDPPYQIGAGCLIDQLAGETMAEVCGLSPLLDPAHIETALRSVVRFNRRDSLMGHFNHLRTFALGEESALLMASYPYGRRPKRPFPYFNEVMTGFEHTVAAHLLFLGQTDSILAELGLQVLTDIRNRYDGRKRSPFNEAEWGHHYARAMASWAGLLAVTGFAWDGRSGTLTFNAATGPAQWFWSNGQAWGTVRQAPNEGSMDVELKVLCGELPLQRLQLKGFGGTLVSSNSRTRFTLTVTS